MELFRWQDFSFTHGGNVFPIGTDALLLAQWVASRISFSKHLLDTGCGCGVIGTLITGQCNVNQLTGIDIDESSVKVSNHNYDVNGIGNISKAHKIDVLEYQESSHDVIICNPPFYSNDILPDEDFKLRTKHLIQTPGSWMSAFQNILTQDGSLFLILPNRELNKWVSAANDHSLYVNERIDLFNKTSQTIPIRTMIRLSKALLPLDITIGSIR